MISSIVSPLGILVLEREPLKYSDLAGNHQRMGAGRRRIRGARVAHLCSVFAVRPPTSRRYPGKPPAVVVLPDPRSCGSRRFATFRRSAFPPTKR